MSKFEVDDSGAPPGYIAQPMYPQVPHGPPVMQQPTAAMHHTTVVIQQPSPRAVKTQRAWSSGMCGCFEDITSCIMVWLCPPCYECHLSTRMGESCCVPICVPGGMITLRTKLRAEHGIQGTVCDDCITYACCAPCATCQMARELNFIDQNPGL